MIASLILPGQRAAEVIADAAAIARWRWLEIETGLTEPFDVDHVVAFCEGYLSRDDRDAIRSEWCRAIMRDLFNA